MVSELERSALDFTRAGKCSSAKHRNSLNIAARRRHALAPDSYLIYAECRTEYASSSSSPIDKRCARTRLCAGLLDEQFTWAGTRTRNSLAPGYLCKRPW
jgi:hypothetical protein